MLLSNAPDIGAFLAKYPKAKSESEAEEAGGIHMAISRPWVLEVMRKKGVY